MLHHSFINQVKDKPAMQKTITTSKINQRILNLVSTPARGFYSNFLTIATTISATGLTVLDTLWYKPYESAFTALEHHSLVASSRQKGILM
jgi:hypothetical protein